MSSSSYSPVPNGYDGEKSAQHVVRVSVWTTGLELLRTLHIGALLGLTVYAAILTSQNDGAGQRESRVKEYDSVSGFEGAWNKLARPFIVEVVLASIFFVATLGSFYLVVVRRHTNLRRSILFLTNLLLFLSWCFFAARDLFPLATFTLSPIDLSYLPSPIVWARVAILTVAAAVVPLIQPRTYVPVDPLEPADEPHPQQTSTLFSFIFYFFMDPVVLKAWRTPAIPYEELPPLADVDRASYLAKTQLEALDPIKRKEKGLRPRHLFIGMLAAFWKTYCILGLMMIIRAAVEFAAPIGINKLLEYLQTGGEGTVVRPWFWILWLLLGPTVSSMALQYYGFLSTGNLVRLESLFTQLLFEHSLRIKMRDEADETSAPTGVPGTTTPEIVIEDTTGLLKGQTTLEDGNLDGAVPDTESDGASGKGKEKKTASIAESSKSSAKPQEAKSAKEASLVGRINTLMSADIDNIGEARDIFSIILYGPLQVVLGTVFLYQILSWSALVGMAINVITLPIPGFLAKIMNRVQGDLMKATDARVQAVTEAINTLRMVKLFAWEEKIKQQLAEKREMELRMIKKRQLTAVAIGTVNWLLPIITMVTCYGLYTKVENQSLTAAKVFSSITVFDMIRHQMYMVTNQLSQIIQAKVSLERFDKFLNGTELLDSVELEIALGTAKELAVSEPAVPEQLKDNIFVHNATFVWNAPGSEESLSRNFRLKIDNLDVPMNKMTIVAGPTGCGKTSFLMALLGEMSLEPSLDPDSGFSLPRSDGVAFAAQESWVMADTVRGNILFGEPLDEERYKKVLFQCALEKDLELFAAGDQTELGEKGLNASGGQKARIGLARAVYSRAQIILLDDVFSALDVHTTRFIIDNCFKGDLMQGRTVILVTHHVSLMEEVADYIVHLSIDGTIESQGPIERMEHAESPSESSSSATQLSPEDTAGVEQALDELNIKAPEKPKDNSDSDGKLVYAEEKGEGRVSRQALLTFFRAAGGPIYWTLYYLDITFGEVLFAVCNYWLGFWAQAYDHVSDPSEVNIWYYLGGYVFLMLLQIGSYDTTFIMWMFGSLRASSNLHARLVDSILGANLRFLDQTPVGRLISRFTKDMKSVDTSLIRLFQGLSEITVTLLLKFFLLIWLVPIFTPTAIIISILGFALGELYIHGQLSVKREMSNAKSPLYSTFQAASSGIVSIRAYGAQERFKDELRTRADKYTRCATTFYNLNRWITIRIDILGAIFAAGLASFLFYGPNRLNAVVTGFALNQAISFADIILWWVRMINEFEVQGNSIERINDYLVIDQEPAPTEQGKPPAAWPTSGEIALEHLSARYYAGGPTVLDDLNLTIASGSRVGIVGRTGSGKSTLTLALLRLIPTEGRCLIDGLDSKTINLDAIRTQITIIPQDPVLLSGSLRFNLDPFDEHDDAELNDIIQLSGLTSSRLTAGAGGAATPMVINLETSITSGGSNLSQGQRQLVSLARALARGSKILVLDEATASVDFATDAIVQQAIRNLRGVTVLTVAHRLSTVMFYDKVLVLGAGKLLEYDTPSNLLKNPDGVLRALVDNSSDKEELERLAEAER